jgi:hypothetical protein
VFYSSFFLFVIQWIVHRSNSRPGSSRQASAVQNGLWSTYISHHVSDIKDCWLDVVAVSSSYLKDCWL